MNRKLLAVVILLGVGLLAAYEMSHGFRGQPAMAIKAPAPSIPLAGDESIHPAALGVDVAPLARPDPDRTVSTPPNPSGPSNETPKAAPALSKPNPTGLPPVAPANKNSAGATPTPPAASETTLPRLALGFVGADAEAEAVWSSAINDPDRPANERKDLIEDLNEDGFPDPKHVTADDLPLILNRLDLIEQLAPAAMDDVNAAAFAEAYKDLVEMVDKITTR